jgi:multidrug efflux system outer membrane protein
MMVINSKIYKYIAVSCIALTFTACKLPEVVSKTNNFVTPANYSEAAKDTVNMAQLARKKYFTDPYLNAIVDSAMVNNQDLNITLQEIEIARNEVRTRKGEYLPFVGVGASAGLDKVGRYTNIGALEENLPIKEGKAMPDPLPNFMLGLNASWEVDIWGKLHNAKKAAISRYLATVEGRNFVITNLVAEIASSYYELLALDNQLEIVKQNITIQTNALEIVKYQKLATRVTELAVKRFEAQVLNTKSLQYDIQQKIVEAENRINFLAGRYPQPVARDHTTFNNLVPNTVSAGLPSQLLANRPDIKQAELNLAAAKLDVKVAKARFYPSLGISAGIGYQAFDPKYLLNTPKSLLYNIAGDLTAPLINRNAIKAAYLTANAKQLQALYDYQRIVLNAYIEVANQMARVSNLQKSYEFKEKEVQALTQSIDISNDLFRSTRADYMEVLLTQRDALESRFDLVETKLQQMSANVSIYRALGGGWN